MGKVTLSLYQGCTNYLTIRTQTSVARRVTWSKFHTEDPQILGATLNKFIHLAPGICSPLPYTRHEGIWGSGGIAPLILNLGTKWRWGFADLPLLPEERAPQYALNRRLGGPQIWPGILFWTTDTYLAPAGIQDPDRPGRSLN
jgi:hypothetical protein